MDLALLSTKVSFWHFHSLKVIGYLMYFVAPDELYKTVSVDWKSIQSTELEELLYGSTMWPDFATWKLTEKASHKMSWKGLI